MPRPATALLLAILWGGVFGIVGFVCGYHGNGWFAANPGNVAPLLGILFTGPAGALLGLWYGLTYALSSLNLKTHFAIGLLLTATIAAATLLLTIPSYQPQAQIVEGTLGDCTSAIADLSARTDHWRNESARVTREGLTIVRANWERTVAPMVYSRPGTVISIHIERVAWVEERAWSNGARNLRLTKWSPESQLERVFVDGPDCRENLRRLASTRTYCLCFERSEGFPPSGFPEYLGLWVAHPIPQELANSRNALIASASGACSR